MFVLARSALYLLPTFDPDRAIPPGNGMMISGQALIAATAASAAASVNAGSRPMQDDVPAGDPLGRPEKLLAGELAVHHGDPPVPPAVEPLRGLEPVAEVAEPAADVDRLLADRQAVVTGRRRAGHHALADPVRQRLFQARPG